MEYKMKTSAKRYDLRRQPIAAVSLAHLKGRIHKLNDRERELNKELANVQRMRKALQEELTVR